MNLDNIRPTWYRICFSSILISLRVVFSSIQADAHVQLYYNDYTSITVQYSGPIIQGSDDITRTMQLWMDGILVATQKQPGLYAYFYTIKGLRYDTTYTFQAKYVEKTDGSDPVTISTTELVVTTDTIRGTLPEDKTLIGGEWTFMDMSHPLIIPFGKTLEIQSKAELSGWNIQVEGSLIADDVIFGTTDAMITIETSPHSILNIRNSIIKLFRVNAKGNADIASSSGEIDTIEMWNQEQGSSFRNNHFSDRTNVIVHGSPEFTIENNRVGSITVEDPAYPFLKAFMIRKNIVSNDIVVTGPLEYEASNSFSRYTIDRNTVGGSIELKRLYYDKQKHDPDHVISNNSVSKGILLSHTTNAHVTVNSATPIIPGGVFLSYSSYNIIDSNRFTHVQLADGSGGSFGGYGIHIGGEDDSESMDYPNYSSRFNDIHDNQISYTTIGLLLSKEATLNSIYTNTFEQNATNVGVGNQSIARDPEIDPPEYNAKYNTIYNNIFRSDPDDEYSFHYQVFGQFADSTVNEWHKEPSPGKNIVNGPQIGGNFWQGYEGVDANGDGFGDTPFMIDDFNQDNYPLIKSIGTDAVFTVDHDGNVLITGEFQTIQADFAELWPLSNEEDVQTLSYGQALAIGKDGGAVIADTDRFKSVIGFYVEQPGLLGGGPSIGLQSQRIPVAMKGIVRVKACNENGSIQPGDLLMLSSRPGTVMKAKPGQLAGYEIYPQNAILGKALESLDTSQGEIKILLTIR
jgi:hypothetical protein